MGILGGATNNQWKIKVTQYSCLDEGVASQQGCFQYHTGITGTKDYSGRYLCMTSSGTIQSYNFAGGNQLVGQNYKNCIRQEEGYCCIQYSVIGTNYAVGATTCAAGGTAGATRCSGSSLCLQEMILIPGAGQTIAGNPTVGENYENFAGST